ncbi:MAG: hypothetical protein HYX79_04680 [Chloroflexi bacterium]|nr:hypothetical protein [Chloroflexota bacterium]
MKKKEDARIPEFQSLEEEQKYWEARGPLTEEHRGRINKPKSGQRLSSFLAVRLTGEELSHLRDMAAEYGVGPSTFARIVLTNVLKSERVLPKQITVEQLKDVLSTTRSQ